MKSQEFLDQVFDINFDEIFELYETINSKIIQGYIIIGKVKMEGYLTEKSRKVFLNHLNIEWRGEMNDVAKQWD